MIIYIFLPGQTSKKQLGGKGTLKRKQCVREFLDEQNEGYQDDLFTGTPFVNKKPSSKVSYFIPRPYEFSTFALISWKGYEAFCFLLSIHYQVLSLDVH